MPLPTIQSLLMQLEELTFNSICEAIEKATQAWKGPMNIYFFSASKVSDLKLGINAENAITKLHDFFEADTTNSLSGRKYYVANKLCLCEAENNAQAAQLISIVYAWLKFKILRRSWMPLPKNCTYLHYLAWSKDNVDKLFISFVDLGLDINAEYYPGDAESTPFATLAKKGKVKLLLLLCQRGEQQITISMQTYLGCLTLCFSDKTYGPSLLSALIERINKEDADSLNAFKVRLAELLNLYSLQDNSHVFSQISPVLSRHNWNDVYELGAQSSLARSLPYRIVPNNTNEPHATDFMLVARSF